MIELCGQVSPLSAAQIRGARAMIRISQAQLAKVASVTKTAIANIETGKSDARSSTLRKIQAALERSGAEFREGGWIVAKERS